MSLECGLSWVACLPRALDDLVQALGQVQCAAFEGRYTVEGRMGYLELCTGGWGIGASGANGRCGTVIHHYPVVTPPPGP